MEAQKLYNLHKNTPVSSNWTTQRHLSAICSDQTDKPINEPQHISIEKQTFNVLIPLVNPEQHKLDSDWKENFHNRIVHNKWKYWSTYKSSVYIWVE